MSRFLRFAVTLCAAFAVVLPTVLWSASIHYRDLDPERSGQYVIAAAIATILAFLAFFALAFAVPLMHTNEQREATTRKNMR